MSYIQLVTTIVDLPSGARIPILTDGISIWDDVVTREIASPYIQDLMDMAFSYNYQTQTWEDGADHIHISLLYPHIRPVFCAADRHSCYGGI